MLSRQQPTIAHEEENKEINNDQNMSKNTDEGEENKVISITNEPTNNPNTDLIKKFFETLLNPTTPIAKKIEMVTSYGLY